MKNKMHGIHYGCFGTNLTFTEEIKVHIAESQVLGRDYQTIDEVTEDY